MAEEHKDHRVFGDLLLRLAYIAGDSGEFDEAHFLAREATDHFVRAGDIGGVGRSLVDRGLWLCYLTYYHETIALHEQAIKLLPAVEVRNRATVLHTLGFCHMHLGDHKLASAYLEEALQASDGLGALVHGKVRWLQASLHFNKAAYKSCEEVLLDVVAKLRQVHAGEAALATIDLAEAQLMAGHPASAYASAHAILPLITTLGGQNRIVRSAESVLADLKRRGEAQMTVETVRSLREIVQEIQGERHLWRSLRT